MNPKTFTLLLSLSIVFSLANAQTSGYRITGSVADSVSAEPLGFVSIAIRYIDSTRIIYSTATDSAGSFSFTNILPGKYKLGLSFVGYGKKILPITIDKADITTGRILLSQSGKELAETEVLSEKPVIKFEPGKIIFDVAKTVTDGAETALEAMQKIPGVTVTQSGSVEVKGKSGVRYLVDGKPSPMAQSNPEAFLRSIPAKNIESIEIVTTPSAKYDASGSAAIINIHLKKGKLEGLNGSVSGGVGTVFDKYNASGNINYKKNKINVFANAYFRDEHMTQSSIDNRQVNAGDTTSYFNSKTSGSNHSRSASGKAGIEYSINKYNSITYALDIDYWQYAGGSSGQMNVNDPTTPSLRQRLSDAQSNYNDFSATNSLNYRKTYDSADRQWTIDIAHTVEKPNTGSTSLSRSYDSLKNELSPLDFYSRTRNYGTNHNILLQTDYTTPLKLKDSKLETGFKEEMNLHNTKNDVYSNMNQTDQIDSIHSSLFKYTESVTAAYVTYTGRYKKFTYSGGLRWEQTYVHSDIANVNQNYADLFPSANIGWEFDAKRSINLSYSRRIDRPGFWMMNNSATYSPYTINMGNPEIKPAYTNSLELGCNAQVKDQSINFAASYSRQTGSFQQINQILPNRITLTQFQNAGTQDDAYTGLSLSFKFTKWWTASVNSGYSYSWFAYTQSGTVIKSQGGSFNMSGNMTFKFWKTASFALWGWGNTGWVEAQTRYKPVGSLTATLKKKFFKDKFTVSISCRDIFQSMQWRSTVNSPGLKEYSSYASASRVGYLTLTYQFGGQTFTPETKGKSSRLGGGGGGGGGGH